MAVRGRKKRSPRRGRHPGRRKYGKSCPVPAVTKRLSGGPWIQREGKLGGPGYAERSERERHHILECAVGRFGYRSTLGSLLVLLRPSTTSTRVRKVVKGDMKWLRDQFGSE